MYRPVRKMKKQGEQNISSSNSNKRMAADAGKVGGGSNKEGDKGKGKN